MSLTPRQRRTDKRTRRRPQRTLSAALGWSLLCVALLSLLIFEIDLHWPHTPLNDLWNLLIVNGQVSVTNPLIGQYINQINKQDLVFFSLAILLGGGLALGLLAPVSASRRRVLWTAVGATGGVVVLCLGLSWSLQLWMQRGQLAPNQIDATLVLDQLGWVVSWVMAYIAGTALGLFLRSRRTRQSAAAESMSAVQTLKARP